MRSLRALRPLPEVLECLELEQGHLVLGTPNVTLDGDQVVQPDGKQLNVPGGNSHGTWKQRFIGPERFNPSKEVERAGIGVEGEVATQSKARGVETEGEIGRSAAKRWMQLL